ncbi:MAG: DUF1549 domain-containing protein [Acidobacteria bacterium]|nr:DUF1549 domain-containing protein [Acidobacteriota bacterium]
MLKRILCAAFLLAAVIAYAVPRYVSAWQVPAMVDFARDIQPIFAANCYGCHGAQKAAAQLRLDVKSLAMQGGLGGIVIKPHDSRASRLIHRVLGMNGEQSMPLGKPALKAQQIKLIQQWIDEGAVWPESLSAISNLKSEIPPHWAFVAPQRPAMPVVKNVDWVKTPVDAFVAAQQAAHGLQPAKEADRETLIRRVSLDLTGLPPTLKEIDDFVNDKSADAYEKVVARLLTSKHYGERWGRWWLDAARYADSNGFEKDRPRSIWPYRDWVINAFNENKPFDQFTIEQLAGDLLPNATLEQRVATGFLRNSMRNEEGGVDPEQFRVEELIDRVDATGKAFLGLTVACAQCHTHKFDPIKHEEYYRFYAFFNSDQEAELEVPDAKQQAKREQILKAVAQRESELQSKNPDWQARQIAWEKSVAALAGNWQTLIADTVTASFGVKFERWSDESFIARGDAATNNVYVFTAKSQQKAITGLRLEVMTDISLPHGGPGRRLADGVAAINEFIAEVVNTANPQQKRKIEFANVTADFEEPNNLAKYIADGSGHTAWTTDTQLALRHEDRKLVIALKEPLTLAANEQLVIQIVQKFPGNEAINFGIHPVVGRFRIATTSDANPTADPVPARVRQIISKPVVQRSAQQQAQVFRYFRTTVKEWAEANQAINDELKPWAYAPTTLALAPREVTRATHLFRRGDWKRPETAALEPGTPAFLHPFPADAPRNRLGLAQWIIDKRNPLTARVIVNRIWQHYFGAGLVATAEDLGTRCESSSHADLLDWLATEFRDGSANGKAWDIRHIHRLIVLSATYRQVSNVTPKLMEADATNRWLARMPRMRVESEIIRDIGLAVSGLLAPVIGGPSVYPPIPDGVLSLSYGRPMDWPTVTSEDRYRRGMYIFWKRNVPYPSLLTFDMPNGDFSCTRRARSNTPLQALTSLNDVTFLEFAQGLAARINKEGGADDTAKIVYGYRLCTGRAPDQFERQQLLNLLWSQRSAFKGRTGAAVYVSSPDASKLPLDADLSELAAWTMVARVMLNLDETITRE